MTMTATLVNCTPHAINFLGHDGSAILTVPPSGKVARCATERREIGLLEVDGVNLAVNETEFGVVSGLPERVGTTFYIVSALVAQALPGRDDLLIPDNTVRDAEGRIVGCTALARV